jgi:hypothetical protein
MGSARKKRKGGNGPGKYTGKLGRRRTLSAELQKMFDWYAAEIGMDPTIHIEGEDLARLGDREYVAEGLALLRRHYNIDDSDPHHLTKLVVHLTRNHVPYFMPPTRPPGRPKRLQAVFPLLDAMLKRPRVRGSAEQLYDWLAEHLRVEPETLEREFRKWKAGGKAGD